MTHCCSGGQANQAATSMYILRFVVVVLSISFYTFCFLRIAAKVHEFIYLPAHFNFHSNCVCTAHYEHCSPVQYMIIKIYIFANSGESLNSIKCGFVGHQLIFFFFHFSLSFSLSLFCCCGDCPSLLHLLQMQCKAQS